MSTTFIICAALLAAIAVVSLVIDSRAVVKRYRVTPQESADLIACRPDQPLSDTYPAGAEHVHHPVINAELCRATEARRRLRGVIETLEADGDEFGVCDDLRALADNIATAQSQDSLPLSGLMPAPSDADRAFADAMDANEHPEWNLASAVWDLYADVAREVATAEAAVQVAALRRGGYRQAQIIALFDPQTSAA